MSRNRNSTECACDLWDLATAAGTAAVDDSALLTQEQWWPKCPYEMGWGYRKDLAGSVYGWRKGSQSSNAPFPGATRELWWTYNVPAAADRYRWKRIQCPLCQRHYAGWYVRQPASLDPPVYALYDTSFWHAKNDEPAEEDLADLIEWTPEMLVDAAREYAGRRSK